MDEIVAMGKRLPFNLIFLYLVLGITISRLINLNARSAQKNLEAGNINAARKARIMIVLGAVLLGGLVLLTLLTVILILMEIATQRGV